MPPGTDAAPSTAANAAWGLEGAAAARRRPWAAEHACPWPRPLLLLALLLRLLLLVLLAELQLLLHVLHVT
jgi:hypothetical protein